MRYSGLLLACAVFAATFAQPAAAQTPASPGIYVVTYFDVDPAAARKTEGVLRQFAVATRKEDGNGELTLLREIGRPGRFAIVEAWRDKAALDAHGAAMKALGDKLQPALASPFDSRQFLPLSVVSVPAGADISKTV